MTAGNSKVSKVEHNTDVPSAVITSVDISAYCTGRPVAAVFHYCCTAASSQQSAVYIIYNNVLSPHLLLPPSSSLAPDRPTRQLVADRTHSVYQHF